jgi:hypothetical protein
VNTTISPRIRGVALPAEHGGWSLTLEPALLGLIVAPSAAGFALAGAALVGFLLRTPLRIVFVDRLRGRWLDRTTQAAHVALLESLLLWLLVGIAIWTADHAWWYPVVPGAVLISTALWHDARSRSRRLLPELAGTIGISAIAAAIALAGGADTVLAYGMWLVMAARVAAAVFFVRLQLRRAKHQPHRHPVNDAAQVVAAVAVIAGAVADLIPPAGAVAVVTLCIIHAVLARRPPPKAAVLGAQQVVLGLTIVLITGLAAIAP